MNYDRINELYGGQIFSAETQKAARDRIHWICSQAQGEKVLDIGCSQGIVCLILGREGFHCVGIDSEKAAIDYASAELKKEEKRTRDRVDFQLSEASQLSFDDSFFDTVILGEILEHLTQPEKVLKEAKRVLRAGGKIIVTVPFGLNPHPDHKRTYYPISFLKIVQPFFRSNSIDTIHNYIIYTGEKDPSYDISKISGEALALEYLSLQNRVEERCLEKEEMLLEKSIQFNEQKKKLNEQIASLSKSDRELRELKEAFTARDSEISKLINFLAAKEGRITKLENMLSNKEGRITELENVLSNQEKVFKASWRWRVGSIFVGSFQLFKEFLTHPVRFVKEPGKRVRIKEYYIGNIKALSQNKEADVLQESPADRTAVKIFPPLGTYNAASEKGEAAMTAEQDKISLGCILDEFTAACFQPECRLVAFRPDNWRAVLEREVPQAIFVESTWRGNAGSWQYRIAKYSVELGNELFHLLAWAKVKKIPSIFWNKEDPPHYDRFIEKAKLFDYVFTTDADCIERYRDELGHGRVFALPFAAQPLIHNPIVEQPREQKACFAGTYYGDSYPERKQDMEHLLRPALGFGLHIYDRQFGVTGPYADSFRFPEIYQPAIKGRLDYEEMVRAYKKYLVFLNVNSIKTSPTMFSRRVFELLASGTPVISTYSRGIEEILGNDLVLITESEADTRMHLENLMDSDYWSKLSVRGIRKVMEEHTYNQRLQYVFAQCGLDLLPTNLPFFTVLSKVGTPQDIENLQYSLANQTYRDFEVILLSENELDEQSLQRMGNTLAGIKIEHISHYPEKDLGTQILSDRGDYIAIFNSTDYYGGNYLKDYALAVMYSNQRDFIGKHSHYVSVNGREELQNPGSEFKLVTQVPAATLVIRKERLDRARLGLLLISDSFQTEDNQILSLDRFNYMHLPSDESADPKTVGLVNI